MGRLNKRKQTKERIRVQASGSTSAALESEANVSMDSKRRASENNIVAPTNTALMQSEAIVMSAPRRRHAFETNSLDHCETPLCAYEHIQPVLQHIARQLHVPPRQLRIWDPYYCDGAVKRHLSVLGFDNVINQNIDFYQRIKDNDIPPHDVIVTNPPYSENHIEKLLHFVTSKNNKPFCLLMPNWVARKAEYSSLMGNATNHLLYLSPIQPYTYTMPSWNTKPEHVQETGETTPYLSSWYISFPDTATLTTMEKRLDSIAKRQQPPVWVVAKTVKGLKWKIQKANKKKDDK
eukprot:CCRYP_005790-RA/>CCRYP_005790-RA protein AED:0.27 eAED:0.27 QI:0/0/0.5/1/0/0/2/789/291